MDFVSIFAIFIVYILGYILLAIPTLSFIFILVIHKKWFACDDNLSFINNFKKICKRELFIGLSELLLSIVGAMLISLLPNPYFQLFEYSEWIILTGFLLIIVLWVILFVPYIKLRTEVFGIPRFPSTKTKKNKSQYKLGVLNAKAIGLYITMPLLSWIIIFASLFNY